MALRREREGDWIPEAEYELIQARVPILCVDLLPLEERGSAVGLIRRQTYEGGQGWCLLGGAVMRNERLVAALARHVEATLGGDLDYELSPAHPLTVAEYFTEPRAGQLHDPRKHAVALCFAGRLSGQPRALGEALEFRWFDRDELDSVEFGFGQGAVVQRILDRLEQRTGDDAPGA